MSRCPVTSEAYNGFCLIVGEGVRFDKFFTIAQPRKIASRQQVCNGCAASAGWPHEIPKRLPNRFGGATVE